MKKFAFSTATLLLIMALLIAVAHAGQVTIMNGTDFQIHQLSLSDTNSNDAGQDLLGSEVLEPGEGLSVNFQGGGKGWDLIAVDGKGTSVTWEDINLSGVSTIILKSDGTADFR